MHKLFDFSVDTFLYCGIDLNLVHAYNSDVARGGAQGAQGARAPLQLLD